MNPAPCGICLARDEQTGELVLITPRLGTLTRKREMTTRDYPVAIYTCQRCGAVREEPIERRTADVPGMCDRRGGPAVV